MQFSFLADQPKWGQIFYKFALELTMWAVSSKFQIPNFHECFNGRKSYLFCMKDTTIMIRRVSFHWSKHWEIILDLELHLNLWKLNVSSSLNLKFVNIFLWNRSTVGWYCTSTIISRALYIFHHIFHLGL